MVYFKNYSVGKEWQVTALTINGKNEEITLRDLEKLGIENDIKDYKILLKQVREVIGNFQAYAKKLDIPNAFMKEVEAELKSVN